MQLTLFSQRDLWSIWAPFSHYCLIYLDAHGYVTFCWLEMGRAWLHVIGKYTPRPSILWTKNLVMPSENFNLELLIQEEKLPLILLYPLTFFNGIFEIYSGLKNHSQLTTLKTMVHVKYYFAKKIFLTEFSTRSHKQNVCVGSMKLI